MNKSTFTLFLLLINYAISTAQNLQDIKERRTLYAGIGLGLDYGGIGFKFEYQPIKWVGVSASVGFNFHSYGLNAGASFYPLPD